MIGTVKIQVRPAEIIEAIKGMEKRKREAFLEDLIAATSPEYLSSIREAPSVGGELHIEGNEIVVLRVGHRREIYKRA